MRTYSQEADYATEKAYYGDYHCYFPEGYSPVQVIDQLPEEK